MAQDKKQVDQIRCIDCDFFKERHYFPHTGGTSGKCYNPKSPKYNQYTVGFWGCTPKKYVVVEQSLFNF